MPSKALLANYTNAPGGSVARMRWFCRPPVRTVPRICCHVPCKSVCRFPLRTVSRICCHVPSEIVRCLTLRQSRGFVAMCQVRSFVVSHHGQSRRICPVLPHRRSVLPCAGGERQWSPTELQRQFCVTRLSLGSSACLLRRRQQHSSVAVQLECLAKLPAFMS